MGIGLTIIRQHVPQVAVPSPYIQPNTQNWQPSIVNQSPMDVQIVSPNQPAYQYEPQTLMEIVPQQNVQVIPCVQQSNYASLIPQGRLVCMCHHHHHHHQPQVDLLSVNSRVKFSLNKVT